MDYVVGSIADLISGNVTPNRPKLSKKALTPTKHMPSPNVTPKSEFVEDRSIFLSPSLQKKKAIVKKSPKRIFQNPDLDVTNENDGNTNSGPKTEKAKKHLRKELEANAGSNKSTETAVPKKKRSKSAEAPSPKKCGTGNALNSSGKENVSDNELTPKKKKKKRISILETNETIEETTETNSSEVTPTKKNKQKKDYTSKNLEDDAQRDDTSLNADLSVNGKSPKKKKKNKNRSQIEQEVIEEPAADAVNENSENKAVSPKKKNKKRKKHTNNQTEQNTENDQHDDEESKPKKKKIKVNPNAVTDKDSDSEHESDNEIESETEENNKKVLDDSADVADQSSDEEETPKPKKAKTEKPKTEGVKEVNTEEEIKRTLFVGNVPFSKKCKKEIKKIFSKYGEIQSVRIRTVPVKDPSVTPKLAVIKQELHPERTTVNVYVKFSNAKCVEDALVENNTVLNNNHLRVSRSGSTGAEHDPRRSVFVGNVPFALEDEGLREKFHRCGEIESVRIVRDRKTNAGKGFGYVNFTSKDGVELALALTEEDLTIKNRIMRVKRCTQVTHRQAQKKERNFQGMNQGKGFPNKQGSQGNFKVSQGNRQRNNQGQGGKNFNRNFNQGGGHQGVRGGNNFGKQDGEGGQKEGAYRRVMNKRKSQDGGEGPPSKLPRAAQPAREKKARKEFVGMTAEKKKKHKFDKGQKKKKALSEILTK